VDCYERGVSLCGLSKSWGLPGLRLGWVACQDQQLLQEVLALKVSGCSVYWTDVNILGWYEVAKAFQPCSWQASYKAW
jgi:aspartate/methionine/tyrosine aminotransferase